MSVAWLYPLLQEFQNPGVIVRLSIRMIAAIGFLSPQRRWLRLLRIAQPLAHSVIPSSGGTPGRNLPLASHRRRTDRTRLRSGRTRPWNPPSDLPRKLADRNIQPIRIYPGDGRLRWLTLGRHEPVGLVETLDWMRKL